MSTEKEKCEKAKTNAQVKHVPKDAQVVMSIIKEMGIQEYEPRVINQLLEFTYRYVTCVLDDAKVFANHARKRTIDLEDVKLATEVVADKAFTSPPPRHIVAKLAEMRNCMPLPPIKPHCGLRLPPDRYCLSACNYKLRALNQPKRMTKTALEGRSTIKTQTKVNTPSGTTLKRQNVNIPKTQIVNIPKPVIKFTTHVKTINTDTKIASASANSTNGIGDLKMELDTDIVSNNSGAINSANGVTSLKREREDEEFESVP